MCDFKTGWHQNKAPKLYANLFLFLRLLAPNHRHLGGQLVVREDSEANQRKFHHTERSVVLTFLPLCVRERSLDVLEAVVCVAWEVVGSIWSFVPFVACTNV
jgi:hypothetical protein